MTDGLLAPDMRRDGADGEVNFDETFGHCGWDVGK
jgi:hypothetical protein